MKIIHYNPLKLKISDHEIDYIAIPINYFWKQKKP